MTKEIHDINTRAVDFVVELIEYIFEYPDDDYMTMECLCRKLHKHGLIDKKDGEWTTDFIERKTEPTISKMEQVEDEPQTEEHCETCKHWEYDAKYKWWHCPLQDNGMYECHYEPRKLTAVEDEPTSSKMEQVEEPQMGDAKPIPLSNRVTHIKDEPQNHSGEVTEMVEDEPKTQTKTQNSNLTFEKRTMRDCYNCRRYETEGECIECHYEPKDECAKEYEELGLRELKELIEADRKDEPSNSEKPNNCEEPQYEMGMGTLKCDNCSEYGSFKCTKCDGEMYFKRLEPNDEPQTERYCTNCKHNGVIADYECRECCGMDHHEFIEPQAERSDK